MEISTTPPHLQSQEMPATYPATNAAFMQVSETPVLAIQTTRTKSIWLILLWLVVLGVLLFTIGSLVAHSINLLEWSGEVFCVLLLVATGLTVGLRKYPTSSDWRLQINKVSSYTPVLGFNTGVYLRNDSSNPNFVFLPWNTITTVVTEASPKALAVTLAPQIVLPIEQFSNPFRVYLPGAILNAFGFDTPEKIAQALQSLAQNSQSLSATGGNAPTIPSNVVATRNNAKNFINVAVVGIILAMLAYMWYSSH